MDKSSKGVSFQILDKREQIDEPGKFIAGRFASHASEWLAAGTPSALMNFIYGVNFTTRAPKTSILPKNTITSSSEREWIVNELQVLTEIQALRKCSKEELEIISPIKVIPKKQMGKFRLVVNMRRLNQGIEDYSLKIEGVDALLKCITRNAYFIKIDLKHGYFHVSIAKQARKFLGIHFNGEFFQFNALPFGASFAPFVFGKLTKHVVSYLRSIGIIGVVYIDDFVFVFQDLQEAIAQVPVIFGNVLRPAF